VYVKIIASQRWDVFWDTVYFYFLECNKLVYFTVVYTGSGLQTQSEQTERSVFSGQLRRTRQSSIQLIYATPDQSFL